MTPLCNAVQRKMLNFFSITLEEGIAIVLRMSVRGIPNNITDIFIEIDRNI